MHFFAEKFAYIKKKQYLCSMKDEIKTYLNSETELNRQTIHIRKIGLKLCISLICISAIILIVSLILILVFI